MELVVSDAAAELIAERGGRLFVWTRRGRCCGGGTTVLDTSSEPPSGRGFRLISDGDGFELYLPEHLSALPEELHLEARRFPLRVEAYWNGCAWVV